QTDRPRHRSGDGGQHLPLRHICPHPPSHSRRGEGARIAEAAMTILISRRRFLQTGAAAAGVFVLGRYIPFPRRAFAEGGPPPGVFDPNVFLKIAADDSRSSASILRWGRG